MIRQTFTVCLATAATLLQLFCVLKARENTSPPLPSLPPPGPGDPLPPVPYNSSASAVSGVWLVVLIFLACTFRSAKPHLLPVWINFVVVTAVTSSVAPTLPTMNAALTFAKQLLVINLTGLSVSIVVNLLVWPTTNRAAYKLDVADWQRSIENCLNAREAVMNEVVAQLDANHGDSEKDNVTAEVKTSQAVDLGRPAQDLLAVLDKMQIDLHYAHREMAIGTCSASDLAKLHALLYDVLEPVLGLLTSAGRANQLVSTVDFPAHRQLLLTEKQMATEAHVVIIGLLNHGLRQLKLLPQSPAPVKNDIEEVQAQNQDLEGLRSRVQSLRDQRPQHIESWQQMCRESNGNENVEDEQSLFFVVLAVRTFFDIGVQSMS
jgi:hypothetical protein